MTSWQSRELQPRYDKFTGEKLSSALPKCSELLSC